MRHFLFTISALVLALLQIFSATQLLAKGLIRDPDIEHGLSVLARPVLAAAGLSPDRVKVLVIKDYSLNAFVTDSEHIFVHSGLILKLKTAAQLQAVIAHEAAHIANGHLARRSINARNARTVTGFGIALALAAAAAGHSEAAGGIGIGIANSAHRVFLSHTRAEEASADQSGLRYLARSGIDPNGMVEVLDIFRGQEMLSTARQDPYARSHPLTRERIRTVKGLAVAYGDRTRESPDYDYWFARAKGKLSAFVRAPKWTKRRASEGPTKDITLMREAIAFHKESNAAKAIAKMNKLIALRPKDPYLRELMGQILLESRKTNAAVASYKRAVALAPNHPLLLGSYGRALLVSGKIKAALKVLEKSRSRDFRNPRVLRDLAQAYAQNNQMGLASLVTAERYALLGHLKDAGIHAKRAAGLLSRGSGGWQRAQDVISAARKAG